MLIAVGCYFVGLTTTSAAGVQITGDLAVAHKIVRMVLPAPAATSATPPEAEARGQPVVVAARLLVCPPPAAAEHATQMEFAGGIATSLLQLLVGARLQYQDQVARTADKLVQWEQLPIMAVISM